MANIANDADDLVRLVHSCDQSFAQWVFIRKRCIYKLLANYDYFGVLPDFLLGEIPSTPQRDSHRAEVVLIHTAKIGKSFIGADGGTAFDNERHVVSLATEWQLGSRADSFDSR